MNMRNLHSNQLVWAEETATRWNAFWPVRLHAMPGFRHARIEVDCATVLSPAWCFSPRTRRHWQCLSPA